MASTSNPELPPPPTLLCSLAPQANSFRTVNECSGFWDFAADPTDVGVRDGWPSRGPPEPKHIAVGSWNEQLPELRDYLGVSWYAKRVARPRALATDRAFLRVGAASYHCSVYVDGVLLGVHEGGHVPFEVALPHASTPAEAVQASQAATEAPPTHVASASQAKPWLVVLRIEAFLSPTRLPPGGLACKPQQFPNASYDFFPLAGLHRPVSVVVLPQFSIEDITVVTSRLTAGGGAELSVRVCASSVTDGSIDVSLYSGDRVGRGAAALASSAAALLATPDGGSRGVFGATLSVPALVALWSPSSPRLHTLRVSLRAGAARLDQYDLVIGIRTVEVAGDAVLLNGAPFSFRGFGRHEDAALSGRGLNLCASVRDAASMRWVGANSYRGAHYPHSEESLDIADREGFAVIGETPAVYLCFHDGNDAIAARLDAAKRATAELVARDKNRACVVLWSLANEPESNEHMGTHGVAVPPPSDASWKAKGQEFFAELFALARALDPSRPLTLAAHPASDVSWIDLCDVVCTNRYNGWCVSNVRCIFLACVSRVTFVRSGTASPATSRRASPSWALHWIMSTQCTAGLSF